MRYQVLASACTLAVITYLHRVGFATAWAEFKAPLGLTDDDLGRLMAAFMMAYGLFEMPWGFLGDRFGVRHMLAAIVLGGSILTAAPCSGRLASHEGVAWIVRLSAGRSIPLRRLPGGNISVDLTHDGRLDAVDRAGLGSGALWMSSRLGGAVAPLLLVWLFAVMGDWKLPVVLAACLGIVWCAVFWPWFRNQPEDDAVRSTRPSATIIASGGPPRPATGTARFPGRVMARSRSVVVLCMMYGFLGFSGNFYLTLLPTYLKHHRHLDSQTAGLLTSLPFAFGVVACLVGGSLSDVIIRRWGKRWSRRPSAWSGCARLAVDPLRRRGPTPCRSGFLLPGLLRQRPGDGPGLGRRRRHRRSLHRSSLGHHEHDGQLHRRPRGPGHGLPVRIGTYGSCPSSIFSGSYLLGAISWLGVDVRRTLEHGG